LFVSASTRQVEVPVLPDRIRLCVQFGGEQEAQNVDSWPSYCEIKQNIEVQNLGREVGKEKITMERKRRNVIWRNKEIKGFWSWRRGKKIMKFRGKWEIWRRRTQETKVLIVERRMCDDRFPRALNYDGTNNKQWYSLILEWYEIFAVK
jgi:hypothetical protein